MKTRIYRIIDADGVSTLVEAASQSQALRVVAEKVYKVELPTALEVARFMRMGVEIVGAEATA